MTTLTRCEVLALQSLLRVACLKVALLSMPSTSVRLLGGEHSACMARCLSAIAKPWAEPGQIRLVGSSGCQPGAGAAGSIVQYSSVASPNWSSLVYITVH